MKIREITKQKLSEVALRRDDEDMMDYDIERGEAQDAADKEAREMRDAPYFVRWYAQSYEWYGDGEPEKGEGRYKPKGDGGRIVAINVPTYAQAQKIADKLDSAYENGDFEDQNVYGKHGKNYYILQYQGADISSMSKMDEYDREHLEKYTHPNFAPVDYAAGEK